MHFEETELAGVFCISLIPMEDERGYFARSFCKNEFEKRGLHHYFVQCNISYNRKKGTVRGLHYQIAPHEEVKIVSCRRGRIFDVVVDIRKDSPTYGEWIGIELSEANHKSLYIPQGFAHGFQTLCDDADVFYLMGHYYFPDSARGILWNDPKLNIAWPIKESIVSEKDKNLPRLMS